MPRHILERSAALPFALEEGRLRVAIADPTDVQTIDELRLATRYPLELAVAPREDIELELRRIVRASEMWERAALVQDESETDEAARTSRPRTASPTRRSSGSSTRSSSRPPRTAPATSTSTR